MFQVFLGCQAGQIVLSYRGHGQRTVRFVIWGVACTLLGLILCGFSLNHGPIPLNKNIWYVPRWEVSLRGGFKMGIRILPSHKIRDFFSFVVEGLVRWSLPTSLPFLPSSIVVQNLLMSEWAPVYWRKGHRLLGTSYASATNLSITSSIEGEKNEDE